MSVFSKIQSHNYGVTMATTIASGNVNVNLELKSAMVAIYSKIVEQLCNYGHLGINHEYPDCHCAI